MKKENRQAAQARRAAERAAAAQKARRNQILKLAAPILVCAILLCALLIALFGPSARKKSAEEAAVTAENSESGSTLLTDDGLEAKDGDLVNIDYVGYLNGEAFAGGNTNGNGADLLLGSHTYIDGFEAGIVGHKVGETFDLNLTFPENYQNADLAGQDVVFTTTLNGIYEN